MNFGIGSAFSKVLGSAFSEGPSPGPGPLYKKYGQQSMQKWLSGNDILMYSTHNEGT